MTIVSAHFHFFDYDVSYCFVVFFGLRPKTDNRMTETLTSAKTSKRRYNSKKTHSCENNNRNAEKKPTNANNNTNK